MAWDERHALNSSTRRLIIAFLSLLHYSHLSNFAFQHSTVFYHAHSYIVSSCSHSTYPAPASISLVYLTHILGRFGASSWMVGPSCFYYNTLVH
jgi:hypothetical protein